MEFTLIFSMVLLKLKSSSGVFGTAIKMDYLCFLTVIDDVIFLSLSIYFITKGVFGCPLASSFFKFHRGAVPNSLTPRS